MPLTIGAALCFRSKIRRLAAAHKSPDEHADNISSPQAHTPAAEQTARVDRRRSQEQSVAESTAETVRSVELLSEELVAIVAMGVLALISYMVRDQPRCTQCLQVALSVVSEHCA